MTVSDTLARSVAEGRRLTDKEIDGLAATDDIISLGMLADEARRRRHSNRTTFVRVANVPPEVGASAQCPPSAGELQIVGRPSGRQAAVDRVREVKRQANGVPVSGYLLSDLEQVAAVEGTTLRALLEDLSAAGLDLIAAAPFDLLQDPRRSVEEVNIAGLALARLTIQAHPTDVLSLFKRVVELQRNVAVIRTFAPLPRAQNTAEPTTGYDDVKRVALARLIVDNVPSIQIDWEAYGPKLAQVALTMGADDLDAVSPLDTSPDGPRRAPLEEVQRNIRAAGQEPVQRNGRFDLVTATHG